MIRLEKNGLVKKVSTGYSWKSLLFGCLYPLTRSDYGGAFRHFFYITISFGLSYLLTPFFYNKKYIKGLIEKGYKPADVDSDLYLTRNFNYTQSSILM